MCVKIKILITKIKYKYFLYIHNDIIKVKQLEHCNDFNIVLYYYLEVVILLD